MTNPHVKRESFIGFDRKRLRGTLSVTMGIKSNEAMFSHRGNTWETTAIDEKLEQNRKALLEKHLRESAQEFEMGKGKGAVIIKPTIKQQRHLERFIREQLADAGPLEPVKYDKQRLAEQKKPKPPARKAGAGSYVAIAQRVNRLAQLERELKKNSPVNAVTSDKRKEYGHFVMEKM